MAINRFVVGGNLTRDPELRDVNDTSVCSFRIAHNVWSRGEDKANFYDVSVWGKRGESLAEHLSKGQQVIVDGRLSVREYEHNGEKRSSLEIRADDVQFAGPKVERESAGAGAADSGDDDSFDIPL